LIVELYGNLGLAICQRMVHGTVILLRLSSSSRTAWNESSLKPSEWTLAASRNWRSLTGAAKSVVRHLSPADFDSAHGLQKLLEALPGWNNGHLEKDYSREHTQFFGEGRGKVHRISTVVEPCETGESGHEVNYDGTERKQPSNVTVEITWTGCWDVTCG